MSDVDRSAVMRAVKSCDTTPELIVRAVVHNQGFRFRVHERKLPGSPDLVFAGLKKVIFVHGCFWHGHSCPRGARVPKSNTEYWVGKVARNKKRDRVVQRELRKEGWRSLTIWECSLKDTDRLAARIRRFLTQLK